MKEAKARLEIRIDSHVNLTALADALEVHGLGFHLRLLYEGVQSFDRSPSRPLTLRLIAGGEITLHPLHDGDLDAIGEALGDALHRELSGDDGAG